MTAFDPVLAARIASSGIPLSAGLVQDTARMTAERETEIVVRWAPIPVDEQPRFTVTNSSRPGTLLSALSYAREDVALLLAELAAVRTERDEARSETAEFASRVNELESRICECEPVREHRDLRRPAFYQHAVDCPVNEVVAS